VERQKGTCLNAPNKEEALGLKLAKWSAVDNLVQNCKLVFARSKNKLRYLGKLTKERLLKLGLTKLVTALDHLNEVNGH
jgi:hypothetical protein